MLPDHLMPCHECFAAFRDAMKACFHSTLDEAHLHKIENFTATYNALDISTTTKVHIMTRYVTEFIQQQEKPLGQFSEQIGEHCHAKFDRLFNSDRIKDINHPGYLNKLYFAKMHFNAYHL